jgi:tetratricopeptide (TPR) repeat protein
MIVLAIILLVVSILVLASLFLVRLSHVNQRPAIRVKVVGSEIHHPSLWLYFKPKLSKAVQVIWYFILEAKDLKPATTKVVHSQLQRVKSAFRIRIRSSEQEPLWLPEATELTIKNNPDLSPEERYLETIKNNPSDRQAYEALARLYLQNKNFADAAETYEYLTKIEPTRDIYFSNLGLAYYSIQDYAKAAAAYEQAIIINAKIPTRWINLALCFEAMDQTNKAVKAIGQALEFDQSNINYLTLLADAYIKLENYIRAEEVLEQILSLEPTNRAVTEKLMRLKV